MGSITNINVYRMINNKWVKIPNKKLSKGQQRRFDALDKDGSICAHLKIDIFGVEYYIVIPHNRGLVGARGVRQNLLKRIDRANAEYLLDCESMDIDDIFSYHK